MNKLLFFLIVTHSTFALGQDMFATAIGADPKQSKPLGLSFELSLSQPTAKIDFGAPIDAIYSGLGVHGRVVFPMYFGKAGSANFTLGAKFLNLTNNLNSTETKEISQYLGPVAGLKFSLYRLFFGAEYSYLSANHYWIGDNSDELAFNLGQFSYFAGLSFKITDDLDFAVEYNLGSGKVPKNATGITQDGTFSDETLWLKFIYTSGKSFNDFLKSAFK